MSEGADDVQSVFGFCINIIIIYVYVGWIFLFIVVCMLFEHYPSVDCDSKDFGAVCRYVKAKKKKKET